MPWQESTIVQRRQEFVMLAEHTDNFAELCRRFGISRGVGYKWVARYRQAGQEGLQDQSRHPHHSPGELPQLLQERIAKLRRRHPTWGARKLRRLLQNEGREPAPACSTITTCLHRAGLIDEEAAGGRSDWQRFEHPAPNALWQMDFKGPVATLNGALRPLTILDDYSRFNLCLRVLPNMRTATVQPQLQAVFGRYGLPDAILVDNAGPWGNDLDSPYTPLTVWLLRLGLRVSHSRPYHPQTLGKDERFHGTLQRELLAGRQWRSREHLQEGCDHWRHEYNFVRPHDALHLEVPASRYRPSLRPFPQVLPPIEYPPEIAVRKVYQGGGASFRGRQVSVPKAFFGYPIGFRPTTVEGVFDIVFCHHVIKQVNINEPESRV